MTVFGQWQGVLFEVKLLRFQDSNPHHFVIRVSHFDIRFSSQDVQPATNLTLFKSASFGDFRIRQGHPAEDESSALRLSPDEPHIEPDRHSHFLFVSRFDESALYANVQAAHSRGAEGLGQFIRSIPERVRILQRCCFRTRAVTVQRYEKLCETVNRTR